MGPAKPGRGTDFPPGLDATSKSEQHDSHLLIARYRPQRKGPGMADPQTAIGRRSSVRLSCAGDHAACVGRCRCRAAFRPGTNAAATKLCSGAGQSDRAVADARDACGHCRRHADRDGCRRANPRQQVVAAREDLPGDQDSKGPDVRQRVGRRRRSPPRPHAHVRLRADLFSEGARRADRDLRHRGASAVEGDFVHRQQGHSPEGARKGTGERVQTEGRRCSSIRS